MKVYSHTCQLVFPDMRTTPLYTVEAETKPIINFPKSPKDELELELGK